MSDIPNLNIRLYQTGDDENIVELLKKTFPKWGKFNDPLALWRWKYIDTPQGSFIIVAVVDNKIVGCNHSIIYNAKLGSRVSSIRWDDDTAVDNDYRNLGIWNKIYDYKIKLGLLAMYGYFTTVNPILINQMKKNKWSNFPFPVTRMMKTKDVDLHLRMRPMKNMLIVKYGYMVLKLLNRISNQFSSPIKRSDEFKIVEISKFEEGIDSFWEKIKDDYSFILEKKQAYLNWRFRYNERGNHIMMQAINGEEILGFAVIGLREDKEYIEGQIEDLIALKDRLDVVDALLDHACKYFDDQGINTVYYQVVKGHPYQEFSKRKGFIDSRSKPYIIFTNVPESEEIEFLKNTTPSQVYFNYAETV